MALNPLIALQGRSIDLATPIQQMQDRKRQETLDTIAVEDRDFQRGRLEKQDARADRSLDLQERGFASGEELKRLQIASANIDNLNKRDQQRFDNLVFAGAALDTFLGNDDLKGAEKFLAERRASLGQRIASGEDVDTRETDEALAAIKSGDPEALEDLKRTATNLVKIGRIRGTLENTDATAIGGATGELADRLIKEGSAKNVGEALFLIRGGAGKGAEIKEDGSIGLRAGVAESAGQLKGAEETGKLEARLELEPDVAEAVEIAKVVAKGKGEAQDRLNLMVAQFPSLQEVTKELSDLGKKATFTKAGQAANTVRRELGFEVGEGAEARREYIAKVDNEILPLLRSTFGAQFTEREGESLKATLGDVNASPAEKDAVLKAFIAQKAAQIDSLSRQVGQEAAPAATEFEGFEIIGVE